MTEQDFRDRYSSIMYKAIRLETENPENLCVTISVMIAVGATISILSSIGCRVDIKKEDKHFVLKHGLKVDFNYTETTTSESRNIRYITPEYAYEKLTDIDNGLDSIDKARHIAEIIDQEFSKNGWGKNWV